MPAVGKITCSISIDPALVVELDGLADAQRISRSMLIERVLRDHIESEKLNVKVAGNPVVMAAMMQAFSRPDVVKAIVAAVGEDLRDDQLELFHRALADTHDKARQAAEGKLKALAESTPTPKSPVSKRKKRK